MSDENNKNEPSAERLDALLLTSLMSSRLCHDLVNPVGALSSGLDVLNDDDMDAEMREEALSLIQSSTDKAIASLKFARLAYGLAGGLEHDVSFDEANELLQAVYASSKADLVWDVASAAAPKAEAKSLLLMVHASADCIPRGGEVEVTGGDGVYNIKITGKRVILNEDLPRALAGATDNLQPKFAPLYMAGLLARDSGGGAIATRDEEQVNMRLEFVRKPAEQALTAG